MVKSGKKWKDVVDDPLRHSVLYGAFELTIDEKNRLSVPSQARKQLNADREDEAIFLFVIVGPNRKTWFYPEKYYEELVNKQEAEIAPDEDALMFDQMNFALADKVEVDKQGRILIDAKFLRRTGTNKEVTLIGVRDHLELWNRQDWDNYVEELEQRRSEIAAAKRSSQSRQLPQTDSGKSQ